MTGDPNFSHYIRILGGGYVAYLGIKTLYSGVIQGGMTGKSWIFGLIFSILFIIVGGGIGNMIDRVFRGGRVVDYLDVQLFDFAIFNFADCFVTVGTLVLVVYVLFFMERDDKRIAAAKQPAEEAPDDNA